MPFSSIVVNMLIMNYRKRNANSDFSIVTMRRAAIIFFES